MKKILLLIAIILFVATVHDKVNGQNAVAENGNSMFTSALTTIYPPGGYNSLEELTAKKPIATVKYQIRERLDKEIDNAGGNDYDAEFLDEKTGKWHRERKVYAISDGNKLYLNGRIFELPIGFMEVIEEGYYMIFLCSTPGEKRVNVSDAGGISVNANVGHIRKKIYYCLDTSTGKARIFDKMLLNQILKNHPDLISQFNNEAGNTTIEVEMKYLKLVNAGME